MTQRQFNLKYLHHFFKAQVIPLGESKPRKILSIDDAALIDGKPVVWVEDASGRANSMNIESVKLVLGKLDYCSEPVYGILKSSGAGMSLREERLNSGRPKESIMVAGSIKNISDFVLKCCELGVWPFGDWAFEQGFIIDKNKVK